MSASYEEFQHELQATFLDEAAECLEKTENAFLALERGDRSQATIDSIFRLAHSFKGSAKAAGFDALARFSHKLEDVLSAMRKDALEASPDVCNALFQSLDILKSMVAGLRRDRCYKLDTQSVEKSLQSLLTRGSDEKPQPAFEIFDEATPPEKKPSSEPPLPAPIQEKHPLAGVEKRPQDEYLRVKLSRLDELVNILGEMVTQNSILRHLAEETGEAFPALRQTIDYLSRQIHEAQTVGFSLRMIPLGPTFQKMERIVRDLSREQGKKVRLKVRGEHTELDRMLVEAISDPLTHLIRNGVDHGLETSSDRCRIGKRDEGTIELSASQTESKVVITVRDDGRGLDIPKIRQKALNKGLITEQQAFTEKEILEFIFLPGFSTRDQVTEVSGRGVGLDVVKQTIKALKGEIIVRSLEGQGTEFKIALPLSLSIIEAMHIEAAGQTFLVPSYQLIETLNISEWAVSQTLGQRHIRIKNELIPAFSLAQSLQLQNTGIDESIGLIAHGRSGKVCFLVNQVLSQQEVLVKKLSGSFAKVKAIQGAAVLKSGEMSLILNLQELEPPADERMAA